MLDLTVRIVRWWRPGQVSDDGGATYYGEQWEPGSLVVANRPWLHVHAGHRRGADGTIARGPTVGHLIDVQDQADGLHGLVYLYPTPTADQLFADILEHGGAVSLEADARPHGDERPGGRVARTAERPAFLTGLSLLAASTARGMLPGAEVLAARRDRQPLEVPIVAPARPVATVRVAGHPVAKRPLPRIDWPADPRCPDTGPSDYHGPPPPPDRQAQYDQGPPDSGPFVTYRRRPTTTRTIIRPQIRRNTA